MKYLNLLVLPFAVWQCTNQSTVPSTMTDGKSVLFTNIVTIDSFIIPGLQRYNWLATTESGTTSILYNHDAEEVLLYNLQQKNITKKYSFGQTPDFDNFRAASFINETPFLISTKFIYRWDSTQLTKIAINPYFKNDQIGVLGSNAACLIENADTAFIFRMSELRPIYTPTTRDVDSIQYKGQFLSLRRLSREKLEHIAHLPSSSLLLSAEVLREPIYDVKPFPIAWDNKLGVIFSPENRIHFYNLTNDSYNFSSSMDIPIPNYKIINRHLDKIIDRNLRMIMQPAIFEPCYTKNKIAINYKHALSEELLVEHKLYDISLYSFDFNLFFSLSNNYTIIYDKNKDSWINAKIPAQMTTIVAILPNNTYIASANPHLVEMDSGQLFYIVKIE